VIGFFIAAERGNGSMLWMWFGAKIYGPLLGKFSLPDTFILTSIKQSSAET